MCPLFLPSADVAALPWSEDHIKNLFSSREGLVDQAVQDSIAVFVQPDLDGEVLGSWIMTEYVFVFHPCH